MLKNVLSRHRPHKFGAKERKILVDQVKNDIQTAMKTSIILLRFVIFVIHFHGLTGMEKRARFWLMYFKERELLETEKSFPEALSQTWTTFKGMNLLPKRSKFCSLNVAPIPMKSETINISRNEYSLQEVNPFTLKMFLSKWYYWQMDLSTWPTDKCYIFPSCKTRKLVHFSRKQDDIEGLICCLSRIFH